MTSCWSAPSAAPTKACALSKEAARPRVAIIGAGLMGRNHARVVAQSTRATLHRIIDPDPAAREALSGEHQVEVAQRLEPPFDFDIAIVAAPTQHHLELGEQLLGGGVPVLIEKPLAPDLESVERIIAAARHSRVPLMCGFVERFNPVIGAVLQATAGQPIRHVVAVRHSPPAPRIAIDVIQDLLIHDIDLACGWAPGEDARITAAGWTTESGMVEVADALVAFDNGTLASLSSDRWSQRKVRSLSVSTDEALFELDLLRHNLTVYRHRAHELVPGGGYRSETLVDIPFVRHAGEPLALQFDHFLNLLADSADLEGELDSYELPHRLAASAIQQAAGGLAGGRSD